MAGKYYVLCEISNKQTFVYAIKSSLTDWHYFEEADSVIQVHSSLRPDLENQIIRPNEQQEVAVDLHTDRIANYVSDGKFVFNGKELRTYAELDGTRTDQPNSTRKQKSTSTDDLVFVEGKSNPPAFLKEFEKCDDTKTDKDKLFKIRNFVNPKDKPAFSKLFFVSDWSTARSSFLKKYSLAFTTNKKTALDFTFDGETSLRSFVLRKMKALSTYTRLSLESQLEIILNELPVEVSNLFIVHDKMNSSKLDILEFCDTVQEMIEAMSDEPDKNETIIPTTIERNQVVQELEIFSCDSKIVSEIDSSEVESSDLEKTAGKAKRSTKRSREGDILHGRPLKVNKIICQEEERDDDSYSSATSSCSDY